MTEAQKTQENGEYINSLEDERSYLKGWENKTLNKLRILCRVKYFYWNIL